MLALIGFWRRLYLIIRANFNHYRYARLDRIAEKKNRGERIKLDREKHMVWLNTSPGEIIRYSGKPPVLITEKSKSKAKAHIEQIHRDRKALIEKYKDVENPFKKGRFYIDPDIARFDRNDPYNYYHRDK